MSTESSTTYRARVAVARFFACTSLAAACAHAQPVPPAPKAASFDPVVVTAARGPQAIEDLLADLTVIGRDEIARSGADGLAKLLSRHHGIEIVQNGGPG